MPWIFLTLLLANTVYFGWKFIEGTQPQARSIKVETPQQGVKIELLSERPDLLHPVAAPVPPVDESVEAQPVIVAQRQCFFVGPFVQGAGADAFVQKMRGRGFVAKAEQRKSLVKDYWVFVPALTNRERAEERVRELRARNIEAFIVSEGRFVNSVSLGHFSRKELAEAFRDKMLAAGVSVEHRVLDKEASEGWVFLAGPAATNDLRATIDRDISKNIALRRENAACEE
ncbi:MAG: SPOR domain-containing protein [Moraxellaceae bacterium]|nr:SPOR domain-containing protein [Moraxellaceae bacterium]